MRFKFDRLKSQALRRDRRRGVGFEEAQALWYGPHCFEPRCDDPEQWRAIGWIEARLFSVIYEEREDSLGPYLHLVTLWPATAEERRIYEENVQI